MFQRCFHYIKCVSLLSRCVTIFLSHPQHCRSLSVCRIYTANYSESPIKAIFSCTSPKKILEMWKLMHQKPRYTDLVRLYGSRSNNTGSYNSHNVNCLSLDPLSPKIYFLQIAKSRNRPGNNHHAMWLHWIWCVKSHLSSQVKMKQPEICGNTSFK